VVKILPIFLLILYCFIPQAFPITILSTFDINDEGWTGETTKETITYHATGGRPGGFLSVEDLYWAETAVTFPPPKFKGDLSEFDGGWISYDVIVLRQPTTAITPITWSDWGGFKINLIGSGNVTFADSLAGLPNPPIPSDQFWTTYYVPMKAEFWHTNDQDHATQPIWEIALSNVTYFDIILDVGGQGIIGLDNFKIESQVIPEPSSILLFSFGLLGTGFVRKKSKQ